MYVNKSREVAEKHQVGVNIALTYILTVKSTISTRQAEIQVGAGPAKNFKTVGAGSIKNIRPAKIRKESKNNIKLWKF